jgi:malate permease and related proteins
VVTFVVPAEQVLVMFFLIALGWVAARLRWISGDAERGMTQILLNFIAPAVVIQAFQRPFDPGQLQLIGLVFGLDIAVFALTALFAAGVFNRRVVRDPERRTALRFGTVYSNAGFIAIPLAQAVLGPDGVFFAAVFVGVYTLFVWTHGVALFGSATEPLAVRVRKVVLNPGVLALVTALVLFTCSVTLPAPVSQAVGYLAAMNTPLSMIVVGANLAAISLGTVFSDRRVWVGAITRNVVVPLVFLGLLALVPIDLVARQAMLISISAPVGAMLVIFTVKHGRDASFATRMLCLSTLLCILTMPAMLLLASVVW